jgi:phage shock protein PspC (stress-responsive transcriptional regulator)
MNEQSNTTSEEAVGPRRFLRSRRDRWVGGVCGGLGRYFGVDPLLFRVGAVALVFIGGLAFLVYPALWLLVPTDNGTGAPSGPSPLRRLLGGADGQIKARRVVAIVAAIVGGALATLALVAGAVWATAAGGGVWVAIAVIVIGLGAVAGALTGRHRAAWLLAPVLVIAAPAGFVAAADVRFDGPFGDRHYHPATLTALPAHGYKLAAGRLRVDLRDLSFARGTTTDLPIRVGMGEATIIVPPSVCLQSDTKIGAGYVDVLGDTEGGFDVRRDVGGARGSAPRLSLRANVGMGALEVVHRPQDAGFDERHGSTRHAIDRAVDNAACNGAVAG